MRRLFFLLLVTTAAFAADPLAPDFSAALNSFRAEGARGWGFVQSTSTRTQSLVERFEPWKPEAQRWTLLTKDGHSPTAEDLSEYRDRLSRRGGGDSAPDVTHQLDLTTGEKVSDDADRTVYRFHLKPGGKDDSSAAYMSASFTYHKPTHTIEAVDLQNREPFSPMFMVHIDEAHTAIRYTLPTPQRPTLLDKISVRVRGRAMWWKSLDDDMTVTYSDFRYEWKHPPPTPTPASS